MFAVVRTGGKQYRVAADDQITVEKLDGRKAKELFGKVQYDLMTTEDTPRVSFKVL